MKNEKKSFQCKGYGHCRMRFSRSEHLARHERKHTGEKACIVPRCSRKFGRFDNMMQQTQTHEMTVSRSKASKSMSVLMDELFLLSDSSVLTSDEEEEEEEMMILPHLANYLVDHPDEPPENCFFKNYHRLSEGDLLYPIEYLSNSNPPNRTKDDDIYITLDELEAIQGLACFYTCQK
ncbi:hypothetical protein INT47_007608 [Mucor saturninus]|uniref:C2H2-type domain-containing protein n=1 Tax=Mucor saturninus TaxID=64648 RepID=A0A8H7RC11_9FUNG|nr:hypothetical protein INT47_007608 [Mucor saturninus]